MRRCKGDREEGNMTGEGRERSRVESRVYLGWAASKLCTKTGGDKARRQKDGLGNQETVLMSVETEEAERLDASSGRAERACSPLCVLQTMLHPWIEG